jgi:uncharacterized membrane protein YeaQ/YmgE (transglycosylase-associated protein family)
MSIIGTVIVGGIAGALGKLIMPGDDPGGIIVTILLGIGGAFVAGMVFPLLGMSADGRIIWDIFTGTVGAIILLALYRLFLKMRSGGGGAA